MQTPTLEELQKKLDDKREIIKKYRKENKMLRDKIDNLKKSPGKRKHDEDSSSPHKRRTISSDDVLPEPSSTVDTEDKQATVEKSPEPEITIADINDNLIFKELISRPNFHSCVCPLIFTDKTAFYCHKGVHGIPNPKQCSHCQQSFSDWHNFMSHSFETHKSDAS